MERLISPQKVQWNSMELFEIPWWNSTNLALKIIVINFAFGIWAKSPRNATYWTGFFIMTRISNIVPVTGPSETLFFNFLAWECLPPSQPQLLTKRRKMGIFHKLVWQTHARIWPTVFWLSIGNKQYLPSIDCTTITATSLIVVYKHKIADGNFHMNRPPPFCLPTRNL